jgi:hypothetical protein
MNIDNPNFFNEQTFMEVGSTSVIIGGSSSFHGISISSLLPFETEPLASTTMRQMRQTYHDINFDTFSPFYRNVCYRIDGLGFFLGYYTLSYQSPFSGGEDIINTNATFQSTFPDYSIDPFQNRPVNVYLSDYRYAGDFKFLKAYFRDSGNGDSEIVVSSERNISTTRDYELVLTGSFRLII